jgi:hypothetical protein
VTEKKNDRKERRHHKRHEVKSASLAFQDKSVEIIDISMGGLAFSYLDRGDWSFEGFDRGMLLGEKDLCLEDVPLKVISDCAINNGLSIIRRCGVKFEKLTPKQLAQLEYFIWANSSARDEEDTGLAEE